ncbi:MAG: hypothetical protein RLZZ502_1415 [Pseudomonadota bacterium]|jgi:hypothetical protein
MDIPTKIIGKPNAIAKFGTPSAENLERALAFNDGLSKAFLGYGMPKGVFRYKSHADMNAHQERCLVEGMARLARERMALAEAKSQ